MGGLRERQSGRVKKEREKRRERDERKVMRAGPPFALPTTRLLLGGRLHPWDRGWTQKAGRFLSSSLCKKNLWGTRESCGP